MVSLTIEVQKRSISPDSQLVQIGENMPTDSSVASYEGSRTPRPRCGKQKEFNAQHNDALHLDDVQGDDKSAPFLSQICTTIIYNVKSILSSISHISDVV